MCWDNGFRRFRDVGQNNSADAEVRIEGAALRHHSPRLVAETAVREAHAADLAVMPWTVNHPRDWSRLIEMGVRWIVTDDPAQLVRYLAGPMGS